MDGLSNLLARLQPRRPPPLDSVPLEAVGGAGELAFSTKALRKFLQSIQAAESPVILDLGPVVGPNVTFFGERLGCKIFVEDLFGDLERHTREGRLEQWSDFLRQRFSIADGTVDGILMWDLVDYMDRPAAQVLAGELTRLLRIDGVLLGFFGTLTPAGASYFTKYVIADEANLVYRPYPSGRGRQQTFQNRDIIRTFDGLRVFESFLLQNNLREILFRKPAYLGASRPTI